MAPDYSYWNAIEQAYNEVDTGWPQFSTDIKKYPSWVVDLLALHWTLCEVENGGLTQYFYNSTGVLAPEAVEGFRNVGLPEFSTVLNQAMAYFGPEYPRERDTRIKLLAGPDEEPDDHWFPKQVEELKPFDDQLSEAADKIFDAMDVYARKHGP